MPFRIVRLIGVVTTAAAAALAAQNEPVSASSPLTLEKQDSLFLGGRDVQCDTPFMNPRLLAHFALDAEERAISL
jgi:hypothetical protein